MVTRDLPSSPGPKRAWRARVPPDACPETPGYLQILHLTGAGYA
jgi:hypothetical protein